MMPTRLPFLLALVLLAPALTGCLGFGGEETSSGLDTQSRAEVSEQTGGIEGVLTDEAVQPVPGADVTIEETGASTETAEDGSFAFSNVQPGSYTLNVTAESFIATETTVDVSPASVATVEIVLAHAPTVQPYSQQFELKGFLECSVASPVVLVAVCAIPNFFLGGNATNDRFIFYHAIEGNPWQMVTEMRWEANQPLARDLALIVEPQGISNDDKTEFGDAEGASPLFVRTDRERFVEVVRNTTAVCEEEKDPSTIGPSRESYCNRNYIDEGGNLQIRVFVANREATTAEGIPVGAGAAIQQDFTIINTLFYNTPACEEYSVFEDNTCPQMNEHPAEDPYEEISGGNETA